MKFYRRYNLLLILFSFVCFSKCTNDKNNAVPNISNGPLFEKLSSSDSGVDFKNVLVEDVNFNNLNYDVLYNGSGVAVGDINNDGLLDIYFGGNQMGDALYLNKGDLTFEDITKSSGIDNNKLWSTSITMIDINNDDYLDIYITKCLLPDESSRKNVLLVNNKNNTFTNRAEEYGIADMGFSTCANFFDYDKDGDLDLYVGNQFNSSEYYKKLERGRIDYKYSDRFYENLGGGKFSDATEKVGIKNYAAALSVNVADFNQDGWLDIYVANDYEEPDYVYYNNRSGGFVEAGKQAVKHMSNFSMGVDIGDINNDGLVDLFIADMVAEDNFRSKTNMGGMNPTKFWNLVNLGYHYQYMFNTLQLNNGGGQFSEIAQMSGVSNTDWSWSPLLADFDLDGYKDLYITNGLMRDIKNKDHTNYIKVAIKEYNQLVKKDLAAAKEKLLNISKQAPSFKVPNYAYRNNGDLLFEDYSQEWNLDLVGWSHGSATADLDNDGDMDLVVNNLNDVATIYRNKAVDQGGTYVGVDISPFNQSIGTQVVLTLEDGSKIHDHVHPVRGYLSQSDHRLKIGVGNKSVKEMTVYFPNGKTVTEKNIATNKTYKYDIRNVKSEGTYTINNKPYATKTNLPIQHIENEYDDYKREVLLPYKLSSLGPCITIGDINGDNYDDLYIGGSAGNAGVTLVQNDEGVEILPNSIFDSHAASEDVSAEFIDIDKDGDLDLIVASGGNENVDKNQDDRLYINNGSGKYSLGTKMKNNTSSGNIVLGDADGDGDKDVLITGRQLPGKYGSNVSSHLYSNNNGILTDITSEVLPDLQDIGMVTDGVWDDIDGDGDEDLVLVGEWMPITVFYNENGKYKKTEIENTEGWWNTIHKSDIDQDGDMDLFIGNLGLNIKYKASVEEPFKLFAKDFDGSGTHDVYLGYYEDGVCYPVRGRQCSSEQMPFVKSKFEKYETFATASIEDVLSGMTEGASIKEAKMFDNVWLQNNDGQYKIKSLPNIAQISPIYTFTDIDIDGDGTKEIFGAGNFYDREVETTRSDAGTGFFLKYIDGEIRIISAVESGIKASGDVRDSGILKLKRGNELLIVANNNAQFDGWIF